MSEFVTRAKLIQVADVTDAPLAVSAPPAAVLQSIDRGFELPNGLYGATIALYLAYIGVMTSAFGSPSLNLPLIVIAFVVVSAFAVPALWVRMRPDNAQQSLTFAALKNRGIDTGSGHLDAKSAAVQVLVMPVLILFWGLSIAVIAAFT